ncbi:glycosyltransferase family 4 protein [Salinibacter ruber]|uniref:glycosyltransferase family 4 protein n=1 Tax=Salinibacter ruber TaxID=146919 RepID=UPI0013C2C02D|nr:glycosyltransferase family 4 protein [Salinibacter ruber]
MTVVHFSIDFSLRSETFVYDYIRGQKEAGIDASVVTLNRVNADERPFPDVHVVDRPGRWNPWRLGRRLRAWRRKEPARTAAWPQVRQGMKSHLASVRPDVVHAHFGPAGVLIGPITEALGCPLVVTFYGNDASSLPRRAFWRTKYRELWSQTDAVTVLSEEMKETVAGLGAPERQLKVVHLSRDIEHFPFRLPQRPVEDVLFVGRLTPKKAPLDAIKAVEKANGRGAGLTLHMVGDGALHDKAERYVEDNQLSESVVLHGRVPNEEVGRRMQGAQAFLLPSKTAPDGDREGTPTVLVEAQASGLPCVSTRHAGIPEMIPEENHDLLVEEGDVTALSEALTGLSTSSVEDLQERVNEGRRKVEDEFSLESEVRKLLSLYRSLGSTK